MKKRWSLVLSFLLVVVATSSTTFGNILVGARSATGRNLVTQPLSPGEEHLLHIFVQTVSLPYTDSGGFSRTSMRWNGGDFTLQSGSPEARFGLEPAGATNARGMIIPPGGPTDGFIPFPQFGVSSVFFTGGPEDAITIPVGSSVAFAQIILKAGTTMGSYSVSFSGAQMLNNLFFDIPTTSAPLPYNVVPEPSSGMLLGLVATGLVFRRRRS